MGKLADPANQVIQGWRDGLVGMQEGGTRLLIIPPDQAYGEISPSPDIAANDNSGYVRGAAAKKLSALDALVAVAMSPTGGDASFDAIQQIADQAAVVLIYLLNAFANKSQ